MDRRIIICIVIFIAASCNRQDVDDGVVESIRFNTELIGTKALIETDNDLMSEGNELTIFDIHTKEDGSVFQYMKDQKLRYSGGKWGFIDGEDNAITIPWTKQGQHHFLAYLSSYGSSDFSISTYAPPAVGGVATDQVISISDLMITQDNQFDFMYANEVRDVENEGTGVITLEMKHLFASVDFQIRNMSGLSMTISSFTIGGMRVEGEAQIGFSANPTLELEDAPISNDFAISDKSITVSDPVSLYDGAFLIWPHKADHYKDIVCSITYKLDNTNSTTVSLNLTAANANITSWDAGCRYLYTITISDIILFDVVRVVDWINNDVILQP